LKRGRGTLVSGAIILALFTGFSLIHIAGGPSRLAYYILHLDVYALLAMLALLGGEMIRAIRLVLLGKSEGACMSYTTALLARLIGRFFGILTPAYTGATPARAAVIASYTEISMGESFAIATLESLFDVFLPVFITLILTIPFLPATWLPFTVSLFIAGMWLAGLSWARSNRFASSMNRLFRGKRRKYLCYMLQQRDLFFKTFGELSRKPLLLATGLLLTIAAHIVESVSIILLAHGLTEIINLSSVIRAFLAMEVSHVMVMTPTPGGALFFEYGLVGILSSGVLVVWRITFIVFSLLPGILLVTVAKRAKAYIEEGVKREVSACDEEDYILRYARTPPRVQPRGVRGAG